jgi:putative DNA primase/helicase
MLARQHTLPVGPVTATAGGGFHYVFRQPGGASLGNRRGSLPEGVDVRGAGGWIVAPGSERPDRSKWQSLVDHPQLAAVFPDGIPYLPQWIRDLIQKRPAKTTFAIEYSRANSTAKAGSRETSYAISALNHSVADLAAAGAGSRNNDANAIAYRMGRMVARGWLDRAEVFIALLQACETNKLVIDDGIDAIKATIESGLVAGICNPHNDLPERAQLGPTGSAPDIRPHLKVIEGDRISQPTLFPSVPESDYAEISRLAELSDLEYLRQRGASAKRLSVSRASLDKLVKASKGDPKEKAGQGRALELREYEPWPIQVEGSTLLDEIVDAIRSYVILSENEARAVALWVLLCHAFDAFNISPKLAITSPEKQCGKTTLLDVLGCLVPRPLLTANTSASPIFRAIELSRPTLLIDEADTFLKKSDELRGILNSGHRKGGSVLRVVGDQHEPRMFSTWAPAAIAMIGKLPDTLEDRSISVRLRRRGRDEIVQRFRPDRTDQLERMARMAARWAADHFERLAKSDPWVPTTLHNRAADNWRPLIGVADAVGRNWPERARMIAEKATATQNDQSTKVMLLGDIRAAFDAAATDRLSTENLVQYLIGQDDRPWPEWTNGMPISKAALSRMLSKFMIHSGSIRLPDGTSPKGFYRRSFEDAFTRYLPPCDATMPHATNQGPSNDLQSATPDAGVADPKWLKIHSGEKSGVVAVCEHGRQADEVSFQEHVPEEGLE